MAKTETAEVAPAAPVAKVGIVQLAIVAMIAVIGSVAAAGGLVWWMGKTGKLGGGGETKIVEVVKTEPQKTKDVVLDPMVVNLMDVSGHAYLRTAVTLRIADEEKPGEKKEEGAEKKPAAGGSQNAAVRDALIDVLGRKTSEELLKPEGKEEIKKEIKAVVTVREPSVKVVDIFFTEFLVQR